jgi:hypothetical protein
MTQDELSDASFWQGDRTQAANSDPVLLFGPVITTVYGCLHLVKAATEGNIENRHGIAVGDTLGVADVVELVTNPRYAAAVIPPRRCSLSRW